MRRYIDADKLHDDLTKIRINLMQEGVDVNPIWRALDCVTKQPTADVVEVVRCKDCKHKEREQPGMVYCPMIVGSWVADDHFCKWGERGE